MANERSKFHVALATACLWLAGAASATAGVPALPAKPLVGRYKCSFMTGGSGLNYRYPDFACVIRAKDGGLELEKLSGSQRIRGKGRVVADGFLFAGLYFCPFGDCDSDVSGKFTRVNSSVFRGVIQNRLDPEDVTIVTLTRERTATGK